KIATNRKGFGFINFEATETGPERRIVFEPGSLNAALSGDTVEYQIIKKVGMDEFGKVVKVLERGKSSYVGIVLEDKGRYFVVPDDRRAYIDILVKDPKNLRKDQKVQVKLLPWTDPRKNPEGEVQKVLGMKGENDVEMEAIVLETGFPADVVAEADEYERNGPGIDAAEIAKRRDMRQTLTFTIDPFDAKDFDDAISFKKLENGLYEIGVHIADVSHYVREGTAIDKEAFKRATSIYLVDRTI